MIRLAVSGAAGRMGAAVLNLARRSDAFFVAAALTESSDPLLGRQVFADDAGLRYTDSTEDAFDVLVDFSAPAGALHWARRCHAAGAAFVCGTTGLTEEQQLVFHVASDRIAVLHAANFSVGMNLLIYLAGLTASRLGESFDIEIVESHHRRKVDAPSGSALALAQAVAEATGRDLAADAVMGRSGAVGPRRRQEIGIHSLRIGEDIGHHEVHFGSEEETVVLQHSARSRHAFARGALVAARWIAGKPAGMYSMFDVIGG
jgi:4-hydroxy-tetrahydrodipicolinate reductase